MEQHSRSPLLAHPSGFLTTPRCRWFTPPETSWIMQLTRLWKHKFQIVSRNFIRVTTEIATPPISMSDSSSSVVKSALIIFCLQSNDFHRSFCSNRISIQFASLSRCSLHRNSFYRKVTKNIKSVWNKSPLKNTHCIIRNVKIWAVIMRVICVVSRILCVHLFRPILALIPP